MAELQKKTQAIIKQIPNINLIEDKLGIQEDDPELATLNKSIQKNFENAQKFIQEGNGKIRAKVHAMPEGARMLTETQY